VSNFAERLRQAMFDKHCKAVDVVRGTKIGASVISRYLSGMNQPSRDNLFTLGKFLEVTPEWLLSSSDAPESKKPAHNISTHKDKIIELLEQMVADKDKQIAWLSESCDALADEIRRWEELWKTSTAKGGGKTKNPTKPNKQKVGFMKKHKKPKK